MATAALEPESSGRELGDATAVDTVDTVKVYWQTCKSWFIYF